MSVADTGEPKVDELEREVDASRAQVSHTLDELQSHVSETLDQWRSKLTAEEITKELKNYASGYVSGLRQRIGTKVRENPASALAMGAVAAWPVYKMARSIPLPVYLMGAGVALMKPIGRAWEHGREAFQDLTPPSSSQPSDRYTQIASPLPDRQSGTGRSEGLADRAGEATAGAASSVRRAAHQAYDRATGTASGRSAGSSRTLQDAGSNPLLLCALGLAASAVVAAAIPRTRRAPPPPRRFAPIPRHHAVTVPEDSARAAVLRAYRVSRREALASGASPAEADLIARNFIIRMGNRSDGAPAGHGQRRRDIR